jgi:hypothetical protein
MATSALSYAGPSSLGRLCRGFGHSGADAGVKPWVEIKRPQQRFARQEPHGREQMRDAPIGLLLIFRHGAEPDVPKALLPDCCKRRLHLRDVLRPLGQ